MKKIILAAMVLSYVTLAISGQEYAGRKASLWRDNSFFSTMYTDPKARNINDIVTIKILETSKASNKATLTTSKKSESSMGITAMLGLETDMKGKLTDGFDPGSMFGGKSSNSNAGSGTSSRETQLTTYISAKVVDLLPNGNMMIEARKEVIVNKEKETVILRGIIRSRDIGYNNIIESTKVADVQIMFAGKGPVSEQTRRGWLSWLLNHIWPF